MSDSEPDTDTNTTSNSTYSRRSSRYYSHWWNRILCRNHQRNRRGDVANPISRRLTLKEKERNLLSALCSIVPVVILTVALVRPTWVNMTGGGCSRKYIGTNQFFYNGHFTVVARHESSDQHITQDLVYHYSSSEDSFMTNCVTAKSVKLMKLIICLSFIAIIVSFIGFTLDLVGTNQRMLKIIRKNALPAIFTAVICVVINGFCYWITVEVDVLQNLTKRHHGSKVEVLFGTGFYLVAAAGGVAVIGTAVSCLRRRHVYSDNRIESLMNEHDRFLSEGPCIDASSLDPLPQPPAYSP